MSTYQNLFQSISIGDLTLPNRVIMTTMKLGYSDKTGTVMDQHIGFYVRRAMGEVGLLTTEPLFILPNGREIPTQLGVHTDAMIPGLRRLTDAVHAAGGRIMAHINHAGRAANPKLVPAEEIVSASDVYCPVAGTSPRPLQPEQIEGLIAAFRAAARRVRQAGFDAIEIPFSHGYLIHQFLSPYTNHRTDQYGGSFENRIRFGLEVLEAVRAEVGAGFPIVVRMNAKDYVAGGLELEDALQIAQTLEQHGVDALSVTSGTMCETVAFCLYPSGTPKANLLPMSAQIREAVSLPVIVAGRIRTPELAEEALRAGQTDLIGLGRPFLSDPDWVVKANADDAEAIILCAACHQGCLAELRKGHGTRCAFNPMVGREAEIEIEPAVAPRRVTVVGGGPAGLEAATIAAQRGHRVVLYEQENQVGGQFLLAAQAPHKEEFRDVLDSMDLVARRAGVEFRLDSPVSAEFLKETRPDVTILATGGIPLTLPFPGLEESNWMLAADVLAGEAAVTTETALVIGGGLVGLETADFLSARGVQVTVLEMLEEVGRDMDILAKNVLLKRLKNHAVTLLPGVQVQRLSADAVYAQQGDQETRLPVESVVIAVGVRANRALTEALTDSDLETHTVGDAVTPRTIRDAIWEGFQIGLEL